MSRRSYYSLAFDLLRVCALCHTHNEWTVFRLSMCIYYMSHLICKTDRLLSALSSSPVDVISMKRCGDWRRFLTLATRMSGVMVGESILTRASHEYLIRFCYLIHAYI